MSPRPAPAAIGRRSLLGGLLLAPTLAAPAFRRPGAQPAARVSIVHINDFHSRHEAVDAATSAACRPDRAPCLGGAPRLAWLIKDLVRQAGAEGRGALRLDAGDQFMGSLFYTHHRGVAELEVMKACGTEAMALGNHEFDNGPPVIGQFVSGAPFPVLGANLDVTAEPALAGKLRPWVEFTRGGARLAVIGLTTETTPGISSPGPNIRFGDAAEAAERAIHGIRAGGPATVVVLSHLGLGADRRLAAEVPGIDVIVGGHSHTLLADLAGAEGPAPTLVEGRDRSVRIVQVGAHGRWVGKLDLDLEASGRVAAHGGGVRPVSPDLPEDPAVATLVANLAAPLEATRRRPVATTATAFDNACRDRECALGNMTSEAMLAAVPGADLAIQNGGGLRAGLPQGQVSYGDVLTVLPFGNMLATVRLRGADLLAALENGVSQPGAGRFLQVAGLRVVWDPASPAGRRIVSATVTGGERAGPVDPERVYLIVTNSFMRAGGDGYTVFRDRALEFYDTGPLLEEVVAGWMAARSPLEPRTDGRIQSR